MVPLSYIGTVDVKKTVQDLLYSQSLHNIEKMTDEKENYDYKSSVVRGLRPVKSM